PANIWLDAGTEPPRVRLLDFGLARGPSEEEAVTQEGMILGTPEYMSPEQADGQALDQRSDLFSLGCMLYECATGRRPSQGKTHTATLVAVAQHQPPAARDINPAVSVGLSELIERLLAKAPGDRPQSAQDVVERLRSLESGQPTA